MYCVCACVCVLPSGWGYVLLLYVCCGECWTDGLFHVDFHLCSLSSLFTPDGSVRLDVLCRRGCAMYVHGVLVVRVNGMCVCVCGCVCLLCLWCWCDMVQPLKEQVNSTVMSLYGMCRV